VKIKTLHSILLLLLTVDLSFAIHLVHKEIVHGYACPKIGIFPVCYFVLLFFIIPLLSLLLKKVSFLFYLFIGIGLSLAIFARVGQINESVQCPHFFNVIPTCFIALSIFSMAL
jgi:hypothetical protein